MGDRYTDDAFQAVHQLLSRLERTWEVVATGDGGMEVRLPPTDGEGHEVSWQVDASGGVRQVVLARHWVSNACVHDEHEGCPLECGWCGEMCRCRCHVGQELDEGDELDRAIAESSFGSPASVEGRANVPRAVVKPLLDELLRGIDKDDG